jgi:hypothetical protein
MKRFAIIFAALFLLLAGVLIFLPAILSTSWARGLVLARANGSVPGEVTITNWTLSWRGAQTVEKLGYRDEAGDLDVRVAKVTVENGLLTLLRSYPDLGTVRVEQPEILVVLPEPQKKPVPGPGQPAVAGDRKAEPKVGAPGAPPAEPVLLPELFLDLQLAGGVVRSVQAGQDPREVLSNLAVTLKLEGVSKPAACTVAFDAGPGRAEFDGLFTLPGADLGRMDDVVLETSLRIRNLDLADLLDVAAARTGAPSGTGRLDAEVQTDGSVSAGLSVSGKATLAGLTLSGPMFKGDRPSLGDIKIDLDVQARGASLSVSNLHAQSGFCDLRVSGAYAGNATDGLSVKAEADLVRILSEFRNTLNIQTNLAVTGGQLKLDADLEGAPDAYEVKAGVVAEGLAGVLAGEAVAWTEPVTLALEARGSTNTFRVDRLTVGSSFLALEGRGDASDFFVTGKADLARGMTEAGKFVDLGTWSARGNAELSLRLRQDGQGKGQLASTLAIEGLSVAEGDVQWAPPGALKADLVTEVATLGESAFRTCRNLRLNWAAWLGKGSVQAEVLRMPAGTSSPAVKGLGVETEVELQALSALLRGRGDLPAHQGLKGNAKLTLAGGLEEQVLDLDDLSLVVENLVIRNKDAVAEEPRVELSAKGRVHLDTGEAVLPVVSCVLSAGSIALRDVEWGKQPKAGLQAAFDLAKARSVYGPLAGMSEKTGLSGTSEWKGSLGAGRDGVLVGDVSGTLSGFKVTEDGKVRIEEETVGLELKVARDGDTTRLEMLRVDARPLSLGVQGVLVQRDDGGRFEVKGSVTPDLAVLTPYLEKLTGAKLEMKGLAENPFEARAAWEGPKPVRLAEVAECRAGMRADLIKLFGLEIKDLAVPFTLSGGMAAVDVRARVNEGLMDLRPRIDFTVPEPVLTLPAETNVLTDIDLTDEVANELLALIHPIFAHASQISGKMDLHMKSFSWPVDPGRRNSATFSGVFHFREVDLAATGFLSQVLDLARIERRNLELGERDVTFVCRDGRIRCSPMKLKVGENHIVVDGTLGLDQTLAYEVQVPVTEKLGGQKIYPYLEGSVLRVPVGGTATKPSIDERAVTRAIADLTGQAARKALEGEAGKLLEQLFK